MPLIIYIVNVWGELKKLCPYSVEKECSVHIKV